MDKRHFTVVIGSKEHGLYVSSKPSSAAKKAVSKLCASNKSKKVEFCLREITQGSKKKTYGPYLGEMKKLKKPIELKGRVIRHEIKVHLKKGKSSTKNTAKKMRGGEDNSSNIRVIVQRVREFKTQLDNFIEIKNFQGIFDAIFNGNIMLYDILTFSKTTNQFFIKMIDYINLLPSNENKNKYFFIICYIIAFIQDKDNNILNYLISIIGLDKFIDIVYRIDYGDVFDRIINSIGNTIIGINTPIIKNNILKKLISIYSKKSLQEFTEVLKKIFSIQDISFGLKSILLFFIKNEIQGFKLFEFLLENKEEFINFIIEFKREILNIYGGENILSIFDEIKTLGTKETQEQLFRNV